MPLLCVEMWYTLHMRVCNRCKLEKPLDEFGINRTTKEGRMYQCKKCNTERASEYYLKVKKDTPEQKEYEKARVFLRHGITEELFKAKLLQQGGGCAVCGKLREKMVIDHDHAHCSGSYGCVECFRGVLCSSCNRGLGIFEDKVEYFQAAINYMDEWRNR